MAIIYYPILTSGTGTPGAPSGSIQANNAGVFTGVIGSSVNFSTGAVSLVSLELTNFLAFGVDTGISRGGAGVLDVGNGTSGDASGTVNAAQYDVAGSQIAASNLSNGVTGTGAIVLAGSPTLTGVPLAPTAAPGTSTTQIATTAFVQASAAITNPMTTLGDTLYENATPTPARLAGNTTTTKKYLSQTGNGTISAAPAWAQIAGADLSNGTTGTGAIVLAGTPTLITPVIGAATGTSLALTSAGFVSFNGDTGISRAIAGVLDVGNGTAGNASGTVNAAQYDVAGSQIAASNLSNGTTGTGAVVLATSPTFVTGLATPAITLNGGTVLTGQSGTGGTLAMTASPTFTGTITAAMLTLSTPLAVAYGGTGTATPALVAGTNITITGSWPDQTINASGGGGSGTVNSGTSGQISYYASTGTAVSGDADLTISAGALTVGVAGSAAGSLVLAQGTSNSDTITINASQATASWTLKLPATAGSANYFLQTDGSGNCSWAAGGGGSGTVTSVTFTGDGTVLSSTPSSAVTSSGTLTAALNTQTANYVLAGPTTGAATYPTFRALVSADLPAIAATSITTGTGSIAITVQANPSTLQVSTVGTRDWFVPNGTTTLPRTLAEGTLHTKAQSQYEMSNSFEWVYGGNSATAFTQNQTNPAITSTAADDCFDGAALSSAVAGQGIDTTSSGITGFGFRLVVPADTFSRTLIIYSSAFSAVVTCSCIMSDGSVSTTTANFDTGSATLAEKGFSIVYNAGRDGQTMSVLVTVTTNHGSSPNIKFIAATLA